MTTSKQKYRHIFDTTHLQSDLKKRSLRSGMVTVGSQAVMFIIQLGSTMILARILSPQDYGINAMAVSITGFAGIFSSLGLSTATVQRKNINHEQVSTLFWINAAIGLLITLVVAAVSPAVAWFFKTPEMLKVMLSLSVIFIIGGLNIQHSALLTRQMRFYTLAKIRILSLTGGILVAIITGYYGFGYWALIFNTLTNVTLMTIGCWLSCNWIPGLPYRHSGVGAMIRFGSDLMGFNAINYFSRNMDNVLIGRYHGSGALGLYSKAYQLLMMPITNLRDPMTSVALPALSRLQNDPDLYKNYYLKCVSLLAFVSMPLVGFMLVYSDQLIHLLLGPQWIGASVIFKILAIAAFVQPVSGTLGMVLISTGRSRLYLKMGVFSAVVICSSFAMGLPWGGKGVAAGYAAANYLVLFPTVYYTFKGTAIRSKDFLYAVGKPLISSLIMVAGCFLLFCFSQHMNTVISLAVGGFAAILIYFSVFACLFSGLNELHDYYSYGKLIFERKNR